MSKVLKCNECNIVIDEMLAYVQNKISVIDEESLVRLCTTSFTSAEIKQSKSLLFDSVPTDCRKILRKNKGKEERDLADIINLFKSVEPDSIPVFVARQLEKLPPITWNNLDCTKLLKDLVQVQNDVKQIREKYATLSQLQDLKAELVSLKNDSLPPSYACNVNLRRGAWLLDSGPMGLSNNHNSTLNETQNNGIISNSEEIKSKSGLEYRNVRVAIKQNSCDDSPAHAPAPAIASPAARETGVQANVTSPFVSRPAWNVRPADNCDNDKAQNRRSVRSDILSDAVITQTLNSSQVEQDTWHTVNYHKKAKRKYRYHGKSGKAKDDTNNFKAADRMVPVFITNIHRNTTADEIVKYVYAKTQETISLQKINTKRRNDYNAFKFFVADSQLSTYLNEELWPNGVIFRRFVSFKNKRSCVTTPVDGLNRHKNGECFT